MAVWSRVGTPTNTHKRRYAVTRLLDVDYRHESNLTQLLTQTVLSTSSMLVDTLRVGLEGWFRRQAQLCEHDDVVLLKLGGQMKPRRSTALLLKRCTVASHLYLC